MSQMPSNQSSPAGSTQLVVIGLVIAVLAVVLVNIYVELRAAAAQENTFNAFQFRIPKDTGDKITEKDFDIVKIPRRFQNAFGENVVKESEAGSGVPSGGWGRELAQSVNKGEVLQASMFLENNRNAAGNDVTSGKRNIALKVNSRDQPPNLSAGDYIDVYANFVQRAGFNQAMLILERVKIIRIGAQSTTQGSDSQRNLRYSNITIELDRDQVKPMLDVQNAVVDQEFNLVVRANNDTAISEGMEQGRINPVVLQRLGVRR